MTELSDDDLLTGIRAHWESRDPVPDGLVARLQTAAALAASDLYDVGLDIELMLLVERTEELAGARGAGHDGVHAALRPRRRRPAAPRLHRRRLLADRRLGGPAVAGHRAVQRDIDTGWSDDATLEVGDTGRFELPDLTPGMLRLRLEPRSTAAPRS